MFIGLVDALKGNFSYLYFKLQQLPKGSFNSHDLQWVNKEISGHGFCMVCVCNHFMVQSTQLFKWQMQATQ
jgi:hypothetical protein